MVRVAEWGNPYPEITYSGIPEPSREKEPYLWKTYEGNFTLEYTPRMPTPTEAVVALSLAIEQFEVDNPGVVVAYAEIDHPTELEMAAGLAVPTCRFQFLSEHHSPSLIVALIAAIGLAIAAGISMSTAGFVTVMAVVFAVFFLIAVGDFVIHEWLRKPELKCPKCDLNLGSVGIEYLKMHWRAAHADQDEPDWEIMAKELSSYDIQYYVTWGLVGMAGLVGGVMLLQRTI